MGRRLTSNRMMQRIGATHASTTARLLDKHTEKTELKETIVTYTPSDRVFTGYMERTNEQQEIRRKDQTLVAVAWVFYATEYIPSASDEWVFRIDGIDYAVIRTEPETTKTFTVFLLERVTPGLLDA